MFPPSLAEDSQQIKVPKHEILGYDILTASKPFWVGHLLMGKSIKNFKVRP
jgi:hypothetical protein